jgi:hypothetical protein
MLAKLTHGSSLTDGVGATATDNALVPQQEITPPYDASHDMIDITSLENLFDNPDTLSWVCVIFEMQWTNADVQAERH